MGASFIADFTGGQTGLTTDRGVSATLQSLAKRHAAIESP